MYVANEIVVNMNGSGPTTNTAPNPVTTRDRVGSRVGELVSEWIIPGSVSEVRPTEDYLPSRLGSTPAGDLTRSFVWGLKGEL